MKKKRKRKKSSARRASDSSEEESDADSKVFSFSFLFFLFFLNNGKTVGCFCSSYTESASVENVTSQNNLKMARVNLNVILPKKKKKRIKEEGDKDKVS